MTPSLRKVFRFVKYEVAYYLAYPIEKIKAKKISRHGLNLLQEVTQILEGEQCHYWIDGGTLLGIVRDNAFIEGDTDLDIGIITKNPEGFCNMLLENGLDVRCYFRNSKNQKKLIKVRKSGVDLDFGIFVKKGDVYYRDSPRKLPHNVQSLGQDKMAIIRYEFDKEMVENLVKYSFCGVKFNIPSSHSDYLSVYYKDWEVRQKSKEYYHQVYSEEVSEYRHHNSAASYVRDEFLFLDD